MSFLFISKNKINLLNWFILRIWYFTEIWHFSMRSVIFHGRGRWLTLILTLSAGWLWQAASFHESVWMTWRKATNPEAQRLLKPRTGPYSHPPISQRPKSYFWWCWSSHKSMSSTNSRNIYYHRPITWTPQPKAFNLLLYGNSHSFRALGHWQLESARNMLTAGGNSVSKSHLCVCGALLFCFRRSLGLVYLCRHQTGVTETLPNGFYSTFTAEAPPSSITPLPALSFVVYPSCGRPSHPFTWSMKWIFIS